MKNVFLLLLLTFIGVSACAQNGVNPRKMVGFGCYYHGEASATVKQVTKLVRDKNYKFIPNLLTSRNNAERYMAVITLERLDSLDLYELHEDEIEKINKVKTSDELVSICSGCTYFDKVSLRKLFADEKLFGLYWLERNVKAE